MELVKFGKLKEQSYTMKESLRALKTNIQFCGDDIRTLLVTSSVPNEGKSTVALDLARSLTESGNRVLFIDTDMRKSVLAGRLRATAASGGEICGLSHYLSGQRRLEEVMYGTEIPGLFMIFAGPSVPNPTEILEKKYFQELLNFGIVDPASTVDFQPLPPGSWDAMLKASGNEKPKKGVTIASNGKTQPIRMILHVNRSKLQSRNATLKIESKEKESYAIYKDVECTQSFLKPGERKREVSVTLDEIPNDPENIELTLYFLPLLPDEEVAATLEYESSSVGVDEPGEDKVMITGGCGSCVGDCVPMNGECGLGSVKVNFELGKGQFDQPGGSVRVDSETLDHNLLSLNSFQVTPEGATTVTMNDEGYPTEANTGLYRTTFEYSKAFSGNTVFVNRIVMKTFHAGASTSFAEAVLELHYTESGSICLRRRYPQRPVFSYFP